MQIQVLEDYFCSFEFVQFRYNLNIEQQKRSRYKNWNTVFFFCLFLKTVLSTKPKIMKKCLCGMQTGHVDEKKLNNKMVEGDRIFLEFRLISTRMHG